MINLDVFNELKSAAKTNTRIFTPQKIVREMLSTLPPEVWNSHTTFLDPAVKSGVYLVEIFNRFMETPSLIKEFPDNKERSKHILKNQIFGIAIDNLSCLTAQRNLYGYIGGESNIRTIENYINLVKNKDSKYYIEAVKKEFNEMKFNVVIGNPPYQDGKSDSNRGAKAVYNNFIEKAKQLCPKYMSFIIPAKWYSGGLGLDDFRRDMLNDYRISEIHDYPDTEDVFQDVYIMGGVCYFIWDSDKKSKMCKIITHQHGNLDIMQRLLLLDGTDTFIRSNRASVIIQKVISNSSGFMDKYISPLTPFGLPSTEKGSLIKTSESQVGWWVTGNDTKGGAMNYIERYEIQKNQDYIDRHKVFITKANDNMLNFPYKVLNKPFYGEPNTACNGSFLVVGPFENKDICENVISYMCTKFFRFCMQQRKYSQNTSQDTYKFVPIQDFSHPWTDEMLYAKYNLTEEEIEYIESTIKPM